MACGAYHHAIIISPCVYARHLFAENVAMDTAFWKYEDAARHLATQLMSKYSNLAVLGFQTSGRVPADVWSDPDKLNACFFSQASRIILLVPSEAEEHINSFARTCLTPLLTRSREEGGRPEWHSRFVAAVIGNVRIPNQLAPGVPFIEVVRFREIGWVRDITGMMLLKRSIKDFWMPSYLTTDDTLGSRLGNLSSTEIDGYSLCETIETSFWLGTNTHVTGQIDINDLDNVIPKGLDSSYTYGRVFRSRSGRRSKSRSRSQSRHTSSSGYRSLEPEFEADQIDERLLDTRITHIVHAATPIILKEPSVGEPIQTQPISPSLEEVTILNESSFIPEIEQPQKMTELDNDQNCTEVTDSLFSASGAITVVPKPALDEPDTAQVHIPEVTRPSSNGDSLETGVSPVSLTEQLSEVPKEVTPPDVLSASEQELSQAHLEDKSCFHTTKVSEKITQVDDLSPKISPVVQNVSEYVSPTSILVEDNMFYHITDSPAQQHPSYAIHTPLKLQLATETCQRAELLEVEQIHLVDGTTKAQLDAIPFIDSEEDRIASRVKLTEHKQPEPAKSDQDSEPKSSNVSTSGSYWSVTRTKPPQSPPQLKHGVHPSLKEPLKVELPVDLNEEIHLTPPKATVESMPRLTPVQPSSASSHKSYSTIERITSGSTKRIPITRATETGRNSIQETRKTIPGESVSTTVFHEESQGEQKDRTSFSSVHPKRSSITKKTITREEFFTESVKIERRVRPFGIVDSTITGEFGPTAPRSERRTEEESHESATEERKSHWVKRSPMRQRTFSEDLLSTGPSSSTRVPQQGKTERTSNRIFYVRSSEPSVGDSPDVTTFEETDRARSAEPSRTSTTPILRSAGHSLPPSPYMTRRPVVKLYPSPWMYPSDATVADASSQIRAPLASGYMAGEGMSCYAFSGTRYRKNKLEVPQLFVCKDAAVWTGPDSAETYRIELLHATAPTTLITPSEQITEPITVVPEKSVNFQEAAPPQKTKQDIKKVISWKLPVVYAISCLIGLLSIIVMYFCVYHNWGAALRPDAFWRWFTLQFTSRRPRQD